MADTIFSETTLVDGATAYGIELESSMLGYFRSYCNLVAEWSSRMNLISKRDQERFTEYHLLDSLKIASCLGMSKVGSLMDFGSGAGLPGIPLAIVYPSMKVTLVDSRLKQTTFLNEVCDQLKLKNVTVSRTRIEDIPTSHNNTFDMVITRATVNLLKYYSISSRFIKIGGTLVSVKGENVDDEIDALSSNVDSSRINILSTVPVEVDGVRSGKIIILRKL